MVARHSPAQQLREARQFAHDYNLAICERSVQGTTTYYVWRKVRGHADVFLFKTTQVAILRRKIERAATTH